MTLGLRQHSVICRLALALMVVLASVCTHASSHHHHHRHYGDYKGEIVTTTTIADNDLQGWNGQVDKCRDMDNLNACLKRIGKSDFRTLKIWYPVVQLGGGLVQTSQIGQYQSFPIGNPTTDEFYIYNAQKPSQSGLFFEIFLGSEWVFRPEWALQTGIDYDQVYTIYNSNGTLVQGADPHSTNFFKYHYNVITRQLMGEAKLLYNFRDQFHPYLLLGLGAAFNTAYNYNTNIPPAVGVTREYKGNTDTAFTYALGLGVDFDITDEIRLGAGYRFTDLGKIQFGQTSIADVGVSGTLSQSHLYSNMVILQATYIF